MIKAELEGIIETVGPIQPTGKTSKYFKQVVILHQPEEEYKGHRMDPEWFVISIISTSATDSRFAKPEQKGSIVKLSVYLKGERWAGGRHGEYQYNHKLTLSEWLQ